MLIKLIGGLVKKLVTNPDKVFVSCQKNDKLKIKVFVDPEDLSTVIGISGRTFRALKAICLMLSDEPVGLVIEKINEN